MKVKLKVKNYKEEKIEIREDFIRLDSLLKFAMIAETGGQAKMMIQDGKVKINDESCTQRGKKVYIGDYVIVGNKKLIIEKA